MNHLWRGHRLGRVDGAFLELPVHPFLCFLIQTATTRSEVVALGVVAVEVMG